MSTPPGPRAALVPLSALRVAPARGGGVLRCAERSAGFGNGGEVDRIEGSKGSSGSGVGVAMIMANSSGAAIGAGVAAGVSGRGVTGGWWTNRSGCGNAGAVSGGGVGASCSTWATFPGAGGRGSNWNDAILRPA